MKNELETLAEYINEAESITVLTGAGISTESGIPDFKSADEHWAEFILSHKGSIQSRFHTSQKYSDEDFVQRYNREYVISESFFNIAPKVFWLIYKSLFETKLMGNYEPNSGHHFLASLEKTGKRVTIITQNVDGLHSKAGSSHVLEVHGTIHKAICPKCKAAYDLDFINHHDIPRCVRPKGSSQVCNFILKPDAVLFGDQTRHYEAAYDATMGCDLFLVMGTSLEVYPISQLHTFISKHNASRKKVIINKTSTHGDSHFHLVLHENIGDVVKAVKTFL